MTKPLSTKDIKALISENHINFVAYVVTEWQLIGAKAVCSYLGSKGITIKPLFVVDAHKDGGYFVKDGDEERLVYRKIEGGFPYFSYLKFLANCIFRGKDENTDLYIASAWAPDFKRAFMTVPSNKVRFQLFLFEEGVSQYRPEFQNIGYLWRHLSVIQFFNKLVNIKLGKRFEKKGLAHYFVPFAYNNGRLKIDNCVVDFYKKVQHIEPVDFKPKRVLIAMQSIQTEEINIVKKVAPILENLGYEVLIKEHPRYPLDDYDLDKYRIDATGKGMEALVPELAPKYIIAFWSTTLLTMNYFYGIIPISLYLLLDFNKMDNEELQASSWFYETFKDTVRYPKTIEELKQILS